MTGRLAVLEAAEPLLGAPGATLADLVGDLLVMLAGDVAQGLDEAYCEITDLTGHPAEEPASARVVLAAVTEDGTEFEVSIQLTGRVLTGLPARAMRHPGQLAVFRTGDQEGN